jgi:hypothetical protein
MTIFDPFAGYGTVGVVSRIYGHDYELWDLNPLLELFHEISSLEPKKIDLKEIINRMAISKVQFVPKWSNLNYWFLKDFLPLLHQTWGF